MNTTLAAFHEAITALSRSRVEDVHGDVVSNLDEKKVLRQMEQKLEALKAAVAAGDFERAGALVSELRDLAKRAGVAEDEPLMELLRSVDPVGLGERERPLSANEKRAWDQLFDRLDVVLGAEIEDRSDLSALQQIEINSAFSDLRTSEQAMSDILKAYNGAARTAVGNLKA